MIKCGIFSFIFEFEEAYDKEHDSKRISYKITNTKLDKWAGNFLSGYTTQSFDWNVNFSDNLRVIDYYIRTRDTGPTYSQRLLINSNTKTIQTCIFAWNQTWYWSLLGHPLQSMIMPYVYAVDNTGILFHSCSIKIKENVYLFVGKSETGKSTTSLLFDSYFNKREMLECIVINDEKNAYIIKSAEIYGANGGGSAGFHSDETGVLKGIFFLEQSSKCALAEINKTEAFLRLQQVIYLPFGIQKFMEQSADETLKLLDKIPAKIFKFTKSPDMPEWFIKNVVEAES